MTRDEYARWWEANELAGALATESCMDPGWRRRMLANQGTTQAPVVEDEDDAA